MLGFAILRSSPDLPSSDIFQELQRRLDQTLGKPGSYHHGVDRESGHVKPMTIGARIYRLENQVGVGV